MQISSASDIYNFFKDCYKLDNKEFTIRNLLGSKYKYKWFTQGQEELLNEQLPILYYNNKKLEDLQKELQLYKLEKALYYASFLIIGKEVQDRFSKDEVVCNPLVLYPCKIIDKESDAFLQIEKDDFLLNHTLINSIAKNESAKSTLKDKLHNAFSECIEDAFEIKRTLDELTDIRTSELVFYPKNWTEKQLRSRIKELTLNDPLEIVPISGTVLIEKSINPTKVISDLEGMARQNVMSNALQELFNPTRLEHLCTSSLLNYRLNAEQIKGLNNSQKYNNSVIVGPPGTGKSYTISAMAVDAILRNKSVLIVSKTKQAVEVVRDNLVEDYGLKNILVDTLGYSFKRSLASKIKKKLSGFTSRKEANQDELKASYFEVIKKTQQFEDLVAKELRLSELTFQEDLSITELLEKFFVRWTASNNTRLMDTLESLNDVILDHNKALKNEIPKIAQENSQANVARYRQELNAYYNALNSKSFSASQNLIETIDFAKITKIFPIWLAHLPELNTLLPQSKELFDLVIIDEATQCDIATALPAIFRAKHVVVCGDPNQLRHYSFIAVAQQQKLLEKYNLPEDAIFDYRNKSILDIYLEKAHDQDQITFLREHYRSTPSLIAFNNQEFYNNQLEIIKSTTQYTHSNQIELTYVNGTRDKKGINKVEAKHILDKLQALIDTYADKSIKPSIGIITPFADQARHINILITININYQYLSDHDVLCGTPYQFQGSEREIILISFGVCNNTHPSAFRHLNQIEVLNVGTTRAKSFQYIFTSVDKDKLNQESLFAKYLNFVTTYSYQPNQIDTKKDKFQEEVTQFLEELKIKEVQYAYPYAGHVLDIFFCHNNTYYFIDLIGYPGEFYHAISLERYKTFARVGIKTIPLHYRFWTDQNVKAKEKIKQQMA